MGIQGNECSFFCLKLKSLSKIAPKHTTERLVLRAKKACQKELRRGHKHVDHTG